MKSYKYLVVNGCSFVHGDQINNGDKWIGNEKRFSMIEFLELLLIG